MLPCVNEPDFRASLKRLEKRHEQAASAAAEAAAGAPGGGLFAVASFTDEFAGFRVLLHTVLSCSAKVEGRVELARHHYGVACACIAGCAEMRNQHLVSALLVLSLISRSLCEDPSQSLALIGLANRMADLSVPGSIGADVRFAALLLAEINTPRTPVCMRTMAIQTQLGHSGPAHDLSWGKKALEPHERFAAYLGHQLRMLALTRSFLTRVGPFLPIVIESLEKMEAMHAETGLLPRFPMRCFVAAEMAILYFFSGKVSESLPHMTQCLRLAQRDPLARCCYPLVVLIQDVRAAAAAVLELRDAKSAAAPVEEVALAASAALSDLSAAELQALQAKSSVIKAEASKFLGTAVDV